MKTVMVSGGFDPVHVGHVDLFNSAKKHGDYLIVVVNSDSWLKRKKGKMFMTSKDRAKIIKNFKSVNEVFVLESDKDDVSEAIEIYKPDIFANGGDRKPHNTPETDVCNRLGVEMVYFVGGDKQRSSSTLLDKYNT